MVLSRDFFAMTVVRDTVYAVGGANRGRLDSVESYTEGGSWSEETEMALPNGKYQHCSVSIKDKDLVVIGGYKGHTVNFDRQYT